MPCREGKQRWGTTGGQTPFTTAGDNPTWGQHRQEETLIEANEETTRAGRDSGQEADGAHTETKGGPRNSDRRTTKQT